jgi:hypothetical protein
VVWLAHLASVAAIVSAWFMAIHYRSASPASATWALGWIGGRALIRAPRDYVVLGAAIIVTGVMILSLILAGAVDQLMRLALAGGVSFAAWSLLDRASRDFRP